MQCPRCMKEDTSPIGVSHFVCNNLNCVDDKGNRTQFRFIEDKKICFPYNQIFMNRSRSEFYRKPYLELEAIGEKSTTY